MSAVFTANLNRGESRLDLPGMLRGTYSPPVLLFILQLVHGSSNVCRSASSVEEITLTLIRSLTHNHARVFIHNTHTHTHASALSLHVLPVSPSLFPRPPFPPHSLPLICLVAAGDPSMTALQDGAAALNQAVSNLTFESQHVRPQLGLRFHEISSVPLSTEKLTALF